METLALFAGYMAIFIASLWAGVAIIKWAFRE